MARNSKVRADRIIILVLVALLVLGGLGFGIYSLFGLLFDDSKNKENETKVPTVVVTTEGINVSLDDYTIYTDDTGDLGFSFIIAELSFSAEEPVSFEFKNLQTSEKIFLNDVSKYTNKMELAGYSLNKLDINTSGISSNENTAKAKLFIPFNTDASSLAVYNATNASKLEFDLTKDHIPATTLKLKNENTEIEVGSTKVSVTNAYISDFMLHNDQRYEIGSSTRIYTFEITVSEAQENVTITDATFIEKGTSEEIKCKSAEYRAIDMDNILGTNLTVGTKGGLFFEVYSNDSTVHDGTLLIKFSNSDKLVEISTDKE